MNTAVSSEEFSLLGQSRWNLLHKTVRDYIDFEMAIRPWWTVRRCEWTANQFNAVLEIHLLDIFLGFGRLLSIGMGFNRKLEIRYLPIADDTIWFTLQAGWDSTEEQAGLEEALASAFWQLPL